MDSFVSGPAVKTEEESAPVLSLTRREIFVIIQNLNETAPIMYKDIENFMSHKLQRQFILSGKTKSSIRRLISEMRKKWQQTSRSEKRFFETFAKWLDVFLHLEETEGKQDLSSIIGSPTDRPSLEFATSSDWTKRRGTKSLRSNVSMDEWSAPVLGLTRREIFFIIKKNLNKTAAVIYKDIEKLMSDKLQRQFVLSNKTKSSIRRLAHEMQKKWQKVRRSEKKFFESFPEWVDVFLPFEETEEK